MQVARRDIDVTGQRRGPFARHLHRERCLAVEPVRHGVHEFRVHMLNHQHRNLKVRREIAKHSRYGGRPSRRRPDHDEASQRRTIDARGTGRREAWYAHLAHQLDLVQQRLGGCVPGIVRHRWRRHHVHGAGAERRKDFAGVPRHVTRDDENGARRFRHDPARRLHTIHHGHEQIHQQDVGRVLLTAAHRLRPVSGNPRQ